MSEGILGSHTSTDAGTFELYEVPVGKYIKANISVCSDTTTANEVVLYISSGLSPLTGDTIQLDTLKSFNRGYDRTAIVMKAGEKLFYKTDSSGTNVIISGFEYDALDEVFAESQLADIDGNYTAYTCGASSTCSVNLVTSLIGTGSTDKATVDVYITKTDIASGVKLQTTNLRRDGITGTGRNGFAVSAGDKIIVTTSGVVGGVAIRAYGFTRGMN
jgi:hypothetical protein